MQPAFSYILYATSSHEQTGDIITFAHFEDKKLVETKGNEEEYGSILYSIEELSTEDDSNDGSISTNALEEIWGGSQINPGINARDARLKIRYCIKQMQSEWKGSKLSLESIFKVLNKVFKAVVNELKNSFPTLG